MIDRGAMIVVCVYVVAFSTGYSLMSWLLHTIPVLHVRPWGDGTVFRDDQGVCYRYQSVTHTCPTSKPEKDIDAAALGDN
jgi:hypothetical protein